MKIKKSNQIKLYLEEFKIILNNYEKWLVFVSFENISKKQAKKNVFIDANKLYFPIAKNINKRLEEIKLIDIKALSREKKDSLVKEVKTSQTWSPTSKSKNLKGLNPYELNKGYFLNRIKVMLTRGTKTTHVFAKDKLLNNYIQSKIKS